MSVALLTSLARSRLVHFFGMGALLVWLAPAEPDDARRIVLDAARIDGVLRAETARLGRSLSSDERAEAIASAVDEEVLAREAARLGIVVDDLEWDEVGCSVQLRRLPGVEWLVPEGLLRLRSGRPFVIEGHDDTRIALEPGASVRLRLWWGQVGRAAGGR